MLTQKEMEQSPLFRDISYEEYLRMMDCFRATQRSYRADDLICDFTSPSAGNSVGIVERGSAALIRIDEEGVATVLEELGPGGVFGRDLAFGASGGDSLEVVSRTGCDVLFIDYCHLLKRCERACTHHSLLVQNMLKLIVDKAQKLSQRVDVLSRRSIRDKLLCYFAIQAGRCGGCFTIPFSLSTLADYISADRSAMMRELKKMREAGLVEVHGRQVCVLQ